MTNDPLSHGDGLSDGQVAFLIESGAFTPEELVDIRARIARGELAELEQRTRQEVVDASFIAEEVATKLGVDIDQVQQRQAEGNLFAFIAEGERRYPTWQFTGDPRHPVLPGLARLIRAFPADMHPASILGFMTTPQDDVRIRAVPVTPVAWLLHGGDPQALSEILDSFLQS